MNTNPNPGSLKAIELGCSCAVLDNARGKGVQASDGTIVFWYDAACAIHGTVGSYTEDQVLRLASRDDGLRVSFKFCDDDLRKLCFKMRKDRKLRHRRDDSCDWFFAVRKVAPVEGSHNASE